MCDLLHKTNFDPGGFAEYFRLSPAHTECGVFVLPDNVSDEEAVFTEPLACVLRGQRVAGLEKGQSVLVVGAGIAGLLHVKLARSLGAERIFATDIRDYRVRAARRFGADDAWLTDGDMASDLRDANSGDLVDLVIVCTGAPAALAASLTAVARGGTVLFFAPSTPEIRLAVPFNESFWRTDLSLRTTYGASPADYASALHIIQTGQIVVRDMVTHRLGLTGAGMGFRLVAEAAESIKVLLDHRH
jgi:L-iditol 2-dehydrogenase